MGWRTGHRTLRPRPPQRPPGGGQHLTRRHCPPRKVGNSFSHILHLKRIDKDLCFETKRPLTPEILPKRSLQKLHLYATSKGIITITCASGIALLSLETVSISLGRVRDGTRLRTRTGPKAWIVASKGNPTSPAPTAKGNTPSKGIHSRCRLRRPFRIRTPAGIRGASLRRPFPHGREAEATLVLRPLLA